MPALPDIFLLGSALFIRSIGVDTPLPVEFALLGSRFGFDSRWLPALLGKSACGADRSSLSAIYPPQMQRELAGGFTASLG